MVDLKTPLVVRLTGTNSELGNFYLSNIGKKMLDEFAKT